MKKLTVDLLLDACGDASVDAGISIRTELEPIAGDGTPIKPAIYEGGVYQRDLRWRGEGDGRRKVEAVVIDNIPSEANQLEAALLRANDKLGLPEIILDLSSATGLPPHLPRRMSSLEFPHRQADAYLRDAVIGNESFPRSDIGTALFAATADNPRALFEWFPQALLFGYWQSHLGKKESQAKLARSWISEIVGYDPATLGITQLGTKGDPINLSSSESIRHDEDHYSGWEPVPGSVRSAGSKKDSLAAIGHGQVPLGGKDAVPLPVSFREIEQLSTVMFPGLRGVWAGDSAENAAGRALLVALGLVAHVNAFGRPFHLRSGCDLRSRKRIWTWLGGEVDEELEPLSIDAAESLFHDCVGSAEAVGLPVGSAWREALIVTPNKSLAAVISKSWPADEPC